MRKLYTVGIVFLLFGVQAFSQKPPTGNAADFEVKTCLHSVSYAGFWRGQGFLTVDEFLVKAKKLGFDGVMLGSDDTEYHFEFTHHRGHSVERVRTQDHLAVFYIPDSNEWEETCARMLAAGFESVESYNPYWDQQGRTFEDVDGYRVVLQNTAWRLTETKRKDDR